jgi:hypothetical protein
VEYLAAAKDRSLPAMLQAALERRYSASPGEGFFTGGGVHTFNNFRHQDDGRQPTVREALQGSINLPFVRIMRDVVRHTIYQGPDNLSRLLEDEDDPRRQEYLARFADREGQVSCAASGTSTAARSPTRSAKTCSTTCARRRPPVRGVPLPVAEGHAPGAGRVPQRAPRRQGVLRAEHRQALRPQRPRGLRPGRPGLRGADPSAAAVARRLPAEQARRHLGRRGEGQRRERQAVYRWLFRTRHKGAKDSRIYTMLELEAFVDIHRRWARVGYPSATWCPRSPPRWAAPATARRRWPS